MTAFPEPVITCQIPLSLYPVHHQIVMDEHRYKVVIAGRRFNKTGMLLAAIAKHLTEPVINTLTGAKLPHRISYIAPTLTQAKAIFWERAKSFFAPVLIGKNEVDKILLLKNGGELRLWGSDVQPDKARGGYDSFQAFDEFTYHRPGVYETVFRARQSDTHAPAWFVGTPNGFNHGYAFFKRAKEYPNTYKSWQYPSVAGGYVSETEVMLARQELSETQWRQEYGAEFIGMEDRVVLDWSFANLDVECSYQSNRPLYISCDFNVGAMAWAIFQRVGGEYRFIDEIALRNVNITKAAECLAERYKNHKAGILITGDSSGNYRNVLSTELSQTAYPQIVSVLRDQYQLDNVAVDLNRNSNPKKQDRLDALNHIVKNAEGSVRLKVNPLTAPVIAFTMERACYIPYSSHVKEPNHREITQEPFQVFVPHMIDAVSYGVWRYDPLPNKIILTKRNPKMIWT